MRITIVLCFFILFLQLNYCKAQENDTAQIQNNASAAKKAFDQILSLYTEYDIVHIGERHWNLTDYNFRVALIGYPRFAEVVNDIVIESGNYLYQKMLDEYILELRDVLDEELCKVWRNTVVTSGVWDAPIYKEFVLAVRKVNEKLPRKKRLRLIAAEPPIDWSKVNTWEEMAPFFGARSIHTPEIIKSEVLNKGRKALIIYGGAHFYPSSNDFAGCGRLRTYLENIIQDKVFSILPLSGEDIFSINFHRQIGVDQFPFFLRVDESKLASFPGKLFFVEAYGTLSEFTDGVLYFGPYPDKYAEYDSVATNDSTYQEELERRKSIMENVTPNCVEPKTSH
ncbi:MAG: hypothetical protein JSV84_07020 [Gemmatimonadota bacterium]|nr:MAG: hypothetical protein JSV84_07020 [Gemmatimonadota bacterium]